MEDWKRSEQIAPNFFPDQPTDMAPAEEYPKVREECSFLGALCHTTGVVTMAGVISLIVAGIVLMVVDNGRSTVATHAVVATLNDPGSGYVIGLYHSSDSHRFN